jgi:hypothetical protein
VGALRLLAGTTPTDNTNLLDLLDVKRPPATNRSDLVSDCHTMGGLSG